MQDKSGNKQNEAPQKTLGAATVLSGVGLHCGLYKGRDIRVTLRPAPPDHGIVFCRTDVGGDEAGDEKGKDPLIPARWDHVVDTRLCTVIGNEAGVQVGTVEHLMAALSGCGVDNALIEIDGPEVPAMDGSSAAFVEAIDSVGLCAQSAPRRAIRVLKEISVEDDKGGMVSLRPGTGCIVAGQIYYDHPSIGLQRREIHLVNGNFRHELANARTFGFLNEVSLLRQAGLALGGSLDNAIVLDEEGVVNPGGLRREDEFIRHKLLDALGDLYLAGGPLIGAYETCRGGHAMNNRLLHTLFADPLAWEWCVADSQDMAKNTQDTQDMGAGESGGCDGGYARAARPGRDLRHDAPLSAGGASSA